MIYLGVFVFNLLSIFFDVEICFFNDNDDGFGEVGVEIWLRLVFIGI